MWAWDLGVTTQSSTPPSDPKLWELHRNPQLCPSPWAGPREPAVGQGSGVGTEKEAPPTSLPVCAQVSGLLLGFVVLMILRL